MLLSSQHEDLSSTTNLSFNALRRKKRVLQVLTNKVQTKRYKLRQKAMSLVWEKLILKGSHVPEIESGSELASERASDKNDAPLSPSLPRNSSREGRRREIYGVDEQRARPSCFMGNDCESSQFA